MIDHRHHKGQISREYIEYIMAIALGLTLIGCSETGRLSKDPPDQGLAADVDTAPAADGAVVDLPPGTLPDLAAETSPELDLEASSDTGPWKLVWSDEFDYTGHPDPSKWDYEEGYVRNGEAQYYTKQRLENARVENGHLVIEARRDNFDGHEYTAASVITAGKASWTYGRIEVRAKLPTGVGMWPAIWMLGTNISQVGWPSCGEIDIMENVGFEPDRIYGTVHTLSFNHQAGTAQGSSIDVDPPYQVFHVYAIEWFTDRIDFFVDDNKYFTFTNTNNGWEDWPFDQPHYLLLNSAVGGGWGGQQGIDTSIFPQLYTIDYVRVYEWTG